MAAAQPPRTTISVEQRPFCHRLHGVCSGVGCGLDKAFLRAPRVSDPDDAQSARVGSFFTPHAVSPGGGGGGGGAQAPPAFSNLPSSQLATMPPWQPEQ